MAEADPSQKEQSQLDAEAVQNVDTELSEPHDDAEAVEDVDIELFESHDEAVNNRRNDRKDEGLDKLIKEINEFANRHMQAAILYLEQTQ